MTTGETECSRPWRGSPRKCLLITIEVGTGTHLEIGCDPVRFQSPVSYIDPDEAAARELEIETDGPGGRFID